MAILAACKKISIKSFVSASMVALMATATCLPSAQAETLASSHIGTMHWRQAQESTDPLKGLDLQELEAEKQRLIKSKASPEAAALLSIVPGAGHFYAGQNTRGAWVLGGFAGTLLISFLSSYLLSSIDNDMARSAAVIANVAPTTAYWSWSISDAYYQTALANNMIDQKTREISLKQKEYGFYSTILHIHF